MEGWIKLHRKFMNWEWYTIPHMVHLFIHFLLKANHEPRKWQGITINRGQFVTGLPTLKKETKISMQSLRTCIKRLKSTGEITDKSTNKFRIITITNYSGYQITGNQDNKQTNRQTNRQLTGNQQATNTKQELKNDKNDKKERISIRKVFDYWNGLFHDSDKEIFKLTESRKAKIRTRLKEKLFNIEKITNKVYESEYMTNIKWCNFDWVIKNEENYVKILEGKYDDKE